MAVLVVLVLCFLVLGCAWALDISCCFGGGAVGFWAYGPGWLHCHGCFGCVVWFGWLVVICIVVRVSVMQVFFVLVLVFVLLVEPCLVCCFFGRSVDALVPGADERRGGLRYASGSRRAGFDPRVPEWGNPAGFVASHRILN